MKMLVVVAAIVLVASGFFPWIRVDSQQLELSGVDAMKFGKPAYLHFFFASVVIAFLLIGKRWSHVVAVLAAALNMAWAFRNFLLFSSCPMGDCPTKLAALYLLLISSAVMLLALLLTKTMYRAVEKDL